MNSEENQNRDAEEAFVQLVALADLSPRFHGTPALAKAEALVTSWLDEAGVSYERQEVSIPGWAPGDDYEVRVTAPMGRVLRAWPMIWSGNTDGSVEGEVENPGVQGLWGDSMTWRKFPVSSDGRIVGYLHARDDGPGAPQPLPIGSDTTVPHFAISRVDGLTIEEWLKDGFKVQVSMRSNAGPIAQAVGSNLIVQIPAAPDATGGPAVIVAHYDSLYNTPGAYDNGSGAVALARLAGYFTANPPARTLTLVFTTAEEWHLGGARVFVDALSAEQLEELDFMLNIDGLGRGSFLEAFAGPESFEREFSTAIAKYASHERPDLKIQSRFPPTCGVDLAPFYAAGVPVGFFTFNDLHILHQPEDIPNQESAANIAWTVPMVAELASTLARGEKVPSPRLAIPF